METLMIMLQCLAGGWLLIEGANKAERTCIRNPSLTVRDRIAEVLRGLGWAFLAVAGAGLMLASIMPRGYLEFGYTLGIVGSALLAIRARVREPKPAEPPDAFDRTQVLRRP